MTTEGRLIYRCNPFYKFSYSDCAPQKIGPALSGLLFQAVIVMQPAENRLRPDSVTGGKLMPMAAGRNARLILVPGFQGLMRREDVRGCRSKRILSG